jgi:hypothetical protein
LFLTRTLSVRLPTPKSWLGRFDPIVGKRDNVQDGRRQSGNGRRRARPENLQVHIGLGLTPKLDFCFLPVKRQRPNVIHNFAPENRRVAGDASWGFRRALPTLSKV